MIGAIHAEMTPDDTMYVTTPLFHSNALNIGYGGVFGVGATMALARKFSVSRFWDDVRKYKATIFNYIGELCRYLYNQPPKPNDSDNTVKTIIGNGLRPEIWMEFKERFGIERVAEMYGTTEHGVAFLNLLNFDKTCGFSSSQFAIVKYDVENEEIVRDENGFMQRVGKGGTGLLIIKRESDYSFTGYTDKKETEKKIFRNVFKKGDIWVDMGDLVRDQGSNHIIFVDRLGDTFRWKGQNVSTTEVEKIFNSFNQVEISSVYGVHIPGTDGRAGMASITLKGDIDEFDLDGLSKVLVENLPPYAIPIFLRIKSALSVTSTFKLLKSTLKKEEFNINTIADALYVMMPRESIYTPLTKEIYENIQNDKVKF
jgi:citronellyl-CoA synthetase